MSAAAATGAFAITLLSLGGAPGTAEFAESVPEQAERPIIDTAATAATRLMDTIGPTILCDQCVSTLARKLLARSVVGDSKKAFGFAVSTI
ncbi:hypothetical protein Pth03_70790 [Planotetraspora thailandica]|uniref:Uncharacterized protein n=1 Tax=Planotetraspora thailandica TaxID=487172 RepID=A0A8J3Y0U9_9ACTN|nr:hypothetical protein Pth03_70790 [Planotetraspora thailandica]